MIRTSETRSGGKYLNVVLDQACHTKETGWTRVVMQQLLIIRLIFRGLKQMSEKTLRNSRGEFGDYTKVVAGARDDLLWPVLNY